MVLSFIHILKTVNLHVQQFRTSCAKGVTFVNKRYTKELGTYSLENGI